MARRILAILIAAGVLLTATSQVHAHAEGFSGAHVVLLNDEIRIEATIHTRDLNLWFPPKKFPDYSKGVCQGFEAEAPQLYEVRLDDEVVPLKSARSFVVEPGLIETDLIYPCTAAAQSLKIDFQKFNKLPKNHAQYVTVDDARNLPPGLKPRPVVQDRIDYDLSTTLISIPALPASLSGATQPGAAAQPIAEAAGSQSSGPSDRIQWFLNGVKHILTGFDHLLFVAALLLVCRTLREAATIITFFTLSHSVTLTLSALNLVRVPSQYIEPAVAATIIFVAVENIAHRPRLRVRCMVTLFFGLIHGLAFAKDLKEQLATTEFVKIVWPLVKFSLGVESGHLTLVALALPVLLLARAKMPRFRSVGVPALSAVIAAVGVYWFSIRVIDVVRERSINAAVAPAELTRAAAPPAGVIPCSA